MKFKGLEMGKSFVVTATTLGVLRYVGNTHLRESALCANAGANLEVKGRSNHCIYLSLEYWLPRYCLFLEVAANI